MASTLSGVPAHLRFGADARTGVPRERDRLIHDHFGVDYELVWDVVQNRIPEFRREIASIPAMRPRL